MDNPSDAVEASAKGSGLFATTHWSVVLAAGESASPSSREALERLCRTYWYPLYAFVRRQGHDTHDAEDLLQTFFAHFLEKSFLMDVDRSKGRFRCFLLAALKHFLANEWDKVNAQKRGGQAQFLSLEHEAVESRYWEEPASSVTPETPYEQRWACVLLERVMQRLTEDFAADGKGEFFEALKAFLVGESRSETYAGLASKFGVSEAALKMKVQRMRHRYPAPYTEFLVPLLAAVDVSRLQLTPRAGRSTPPAKDDPAHWVGPQRSFQVQPPIAALLIPTAKGKGPRREPDSWAHLRRCLSSFARLRAWRLRFRPKAPRLGGGSAADRPDWGC